MILQACRTFRSLTFASLTCFFAAIVARGDYQFSTYPNGIALTAPNALAIDQAGNIYIAESGSSTIKKISSSGVWSVFAGATGQPGSANGLGGDARFDFPQGIAVDAAGNVFVADSGNNTVRKITPEGLVSTLAGTSGGGSGAGYGSSDGNGASASFRLPYGIAVDAAGNVYVSDTFNHTIRKITSSGTVTTLAGSAGNSGKLDGNGTSAKFSFPRGLTVDGSGNVFVADSANHTIRKISANGDVSTIAGLAGSFGSGNGVGTLARFTFPHAVALNSDGSLLVADSSNNELRKVTSNGTVTTIAGATAPGSADGNGASVRFNAPDGVAVDAFNNVYVADTLNNAIRKGMIDAVPRITEQPGHRHVYVGQAVEFWVGAISNFSISYQWRKEGIDLPNSNAATLTIPSARQTDAGSYTVILTNSLGTTSSITVVLTVDRHPPGDFNGDGQSDILWQNVGSGDHGLWVMNGVTPTAWISLPVIALDWQIVGIGDFNGDGQADILWENVGSGDRGIWIMNGTVPAAWINLPSIALNWRIVGTGDFNGDGQTDILWENVGSGDRGMWIMNGTVPAAWINLPSIALNWRIVGTGDFNGDGQTDILWENVGSGDRGMWIMNGTIPAAWVNLPSIALNWKIAGTGDYNGDGQADIIWENESSGDRGLWLMNRTVPSAWINLPTLTLDWRIAQ